MEQKWLAFRLRINSQLLHDAALEGDSDLVKKLIKNIHYLQIDLQKPNTNGSTPLMCAVGSQGVASEISIMLLEAGSKPHFIPTGYEDKCHPSIIYLIANKKINLVKLLLWYDPEYQNIKDCLNESITETIQQYYPQGKKAIEAASQDAKKVIQYKTEAEAALPKQQYADAALKFGEIARIFYNHSQIEAKLSVYKSNDPQDKANCAVLTEFYLQKANHYLTQAFQAAKQINLPDNAFQTNIEKLKQLQIDVLANLIDCCENKQDIPQAGKYREQRNQLLRNSEDSLSSDTDEELNEKNTATQPLLSSNPYGIYHRHSSKTNMTTTDLTARDTPEVSHKFN